MTTPDAPPGMRPGLLRSPPCWPRPVPPISLSREDGDDLAERYGLCTAKAILEDRGWETEALMARARAGMAAMVAARVGGDCWAPEAPASAAESGRPALLIVAQVCDDAATLKRMVTAVERDRDGRKVIFFAPPVGSTPVRPEIRSIALRQKWRLIDQPVDPWSLLDMTDTVFTVGHEIGLLALMKGLGVRCFGRPDYSGWGLTMDDPSIPPRAFQRSIEEILAATCILATRYRDPFTGESSGFEASCALLADWRRADRANRGIAVCLGMSIWKQGRIRDLLRSQAGAPRFSNRVADAVRTARRHGGAIAVWASREPPGLAKTAIRAGVPVVRVEDGFLRSVGLGTNFMPAASIVVDAAGMYFDPRQPSSLDLILNRSIFEPPLIERARRLIERLIAGGITKYNVGADMPALPPLQGARTIFVPGQVENDRSVILGGGGVTRNIDLLRRVRSDNPDAIILYKPHPDVDAGHRPGAVRDLDVLTFANAILRGVSSAAILAAVDEVHTLTSLAGFEALIRGKRVVVYGRPFYAGWGLTVDFARVAHRQRILALEELVAGTIILYPRYIDPVTRLPCGPELLIERLSHPELWKPGSLVRLRRLQGIINRRLRNPSAAKPGLL